VRSCIAIVLLCLLNSPIRAEDCVASVYSIGDRSQRGTRTASGIPFDDNAMTAAHRSVKFGSRVRVTNKSNGNSATVTITDRGPYARGSLHRSVESRGAHPRIYWTCLSGRLTGNNGLDDTTRNELGVAATGVALSSGPERKATQG
jgi:hypothetical protein